MVSFEDLKTRIANTTSKLAAANQSQLLIFHEKGKLSPEELSSLLDQIDKLDLDQIQSIWEMTKKQLAMDKETGESYKLDPIDSFASTLNSSKEDLESWYNLGISAIQKGEVAALVLSGGQGTRLGFSGPKGMYDIGLPSGKTLFQFQTERIKKLCETAKTDGEKPASLPFYVMTSPLNDKITKDFFAEKKNFGLSSSEIHFFQQGTLPCLTEEGKIILESSHNIAVAPDGNGGIYPALLKSGALADMKKRGIKYLHIFAVDNVAVKAADPTFIGYCIANNSDCGNKVVWKSNPHEKVGVVALKNGKSCIVEYSEMDEKSCEATDESGKLLFGAGNICNHFYTLEFIENKILKNMDSLYHIARKKIPCAGADGTTIKPESNNGIKLEAFIFDPFPLSENMALFEIAREEEFAPVKNAPGDASDSPDTARELLSNLAKQYVTNAGGKLIGDPDALCEISPLTSYGGEGLEELVGDKEINMPFVL